MVDEQRTCPDCGTRGTGRYCAECGRPSFSACPSCGEDLPAKARFCAECGASLSKSPPSASRAFLGPNRSWHVAGFVGLVLAVMGGALLIDGRSAPSASPAADASPALGASGVDLSSMTPREAADRLFNRVMAADEAGDAAEVASFGPMAVNAYERVQGWDEDTRYHVGVLHLALKEFERARAEADAISSAAPNHLLGIMLRHGVAVGMGDAKGAAEANAAFLSAYEGEIAHSRQEYLDHQKAIDRFRERALAGE